MREILISAGVCLGCLMLALVSQIVAPTPAEASGTITPPPPEVRTGAALNPAAPAFNQKFLSTIPFSFQSSILGTISDK